MIFETASLVDLSHKLNADVQVYPGDTPFACHPTAWVDKDGYSVQAISMGSHTGTHIDAPSHFFSDGKTIDEIPLASLIGPALVIDLTLKKLKERQKILWDDLAPYSEQMKEDVILLIHTGWSEHWCTPKYFEHPFLAEDAAKRILERGVRIVGMDTLNPDETPYNGVGGEDGFGVHEAILGVGGIIAENLTNLSTLKGQDVMGIWMVDHEQIKLQTFGVIMYSKVV